MIDTQLSNDKKLKQIVNILANEGASKVGVFGSYARGEHTKKSDIDILVEFKQGIRKSLLDMVKLEHRLEDRVHQKVDLLTEKAISPYIINRVKQEERVIYE